MVEMHEDQKAWHAWLASEDGKRCTDAFGLGGPSLPTNEYLLNRLWYAFMAGRATVNGSGDAK